MSSPTPIAVVGVSAIFPGSIDKTGFWRDILRGTDRITDVPPTHWLIEDYYDPDPSVPDKTYGKRGAFLGDIDFDTLAWGIPPNLLPQTDTVQLLALIAAHRVLEDAARGDFQHMDRDRISVILGVTSAQDLLGKMVSRIQHPIWRKALREMGYPEDEVDEACRRIASHYADWEESTFPGLLGNVVAGRIANRLDLGGTNCVTDAACASSFSAISMAVNELALGQSDLVISGGCDTMNDIFMFMCFSKTPALSKKGDITPFSDQADGTLLGEGIGMVALKRLADAERDGDPVYAVLKGVGGSSDGRAKSVYAPRPEGQAKAIRRAYAQAGFDPATVELIEAHGTGTKAGDAAEFEGLKLAFGDPGERRQWCAIGSVKSQIGHTKAAAGAAGLFKAVMALHHKVLPPTIKVDRPNPALDLENTPFYINTHARPWIGHAEHPRRAGVSSFGFGGSNFHLAVEEYRGEHPAARLRTLPTELFCFSGEDPDDLARTVETALERLEPAAFLHMAYTSNHQTASGPARLAVVASDADDLRAKLEGALKHLRAGGAALETPDGLFFAMATAPGEVALLFPGQGSQYVEMGAGLAMAFDDARSVWDDAAVLEPPIHPVVFPIPKFDEAARRTDVERLTETPWAQPAIGLHSLATLALLRGVGLHPAMVGGHSFGEVMALCAAGALAPLDAIRVARRRGELMAEAAHKPGAMAALPCSIEAVHEVIEPLDGVVVANHNAPTQVVISGATEAIEAAIDAFAVRGIEARRLPVATAFHSAIVADAAAPFEAFLQDITVSSPTLPTWSNSEARPYPAEPEAIRALLAGQIARPVRFVEQIEAMYEAGARVFVECGPGGVLTRLTRQILGDRPHVAVSTDRRGKDDVTALQLALAQLFVSGLELDLAPLWRGYGVPVDPATVVPPKMPVTINGANVGMPYPPPDGAAGLPAPNGPRPEPEPQIVYVERDPVASSTPVQEPTMSSTSTGDSWVAAFAEAQRQTAEAHAAYQNAMASSHQAYLRTVESSFATLSALATGRPVAWPNATAPAETLHASGPILPSSSPEPIAPTPAPPAPAPVVAPPTTTATVTPAAPPASAAAPPSPTPASTVTHDAASTSTTAPPTAPSAGIDLSRLLLEVVAEKTGYPADMLNMDMSLEGDLGVDSIKRVEILAAMREREPSLPEVDAAQLGSLGTLGQIVEHMRTVTGEDVGPAAPAAAAPSTGIDLRQLLLEVVAEKTGYPADMLNMDMSLEGDLGVDSIKRVEILAAMREREPSLPEVDAAQLGSLGTLGQIVEHMRAVTGGSTANFREAQPDSGTSALGQHPELGRFALELIEAPAVGLSQPGLHHTLWVVGSERLPDTLRQAILAALQDRGIDARPSSLERLPETARAALYLGGLAPLPDRATASGIALEAFHLAKRLAPVMEEDGGLFITVQDTGGDLGLAGTDRAWLGGLPGLTKTAAQEWPRAHTKAIDIATEGMDPATVAASIADELVAGGPEREVALGHSRRVPVSVARPARPEASPIGAGDLVVVSGGARGVTAACIIELARATRARFALLGRTALTEEDPALRDAHTEAAIKRILLDRARARGDAITPAELGRASRTVLANREIRTTLSAIEAAGGEARYIAVDITDADAVHSAIRDLRHRWGPTKLVIHGAGVLADKTIAAKTPEQFAFVYRTKVDGLQALLDATEDDRPGFVMFSSVAGRCGNQGQCDYAMANEVLNKLTHLLARRGRFAKSLGWGPWEGGMVTPSLKARFEALGVPLIPLAIGAQMLVDEVMDRSTDREVVLGGEPRAEALAAEPGAPTMELAVRVDGRRYPWLADHTIGGTPVVPVVLVIEWIAAAARAFHPELHLSSIRDIRVLAGIKVPDLDRGIWLHLHLEQLENGSGRTLAATLTDPDGRKHYTATVRMDTAPPRPARAPAALKLEPFEGPVYDGDVLFHGSRLQVVTAVDGLGDAGLQARLQGARSMGWTERYATDPAALDGGLQLVLLWARHALGGPTLPTSVGAFTPYGSGPAEGPLRVVVRGQVRSSSRTLSDVVLLTEDGSVYAEMSDVETHLRPH